MPNKMWTVGYEKRTPEEVLAMLKGAGIGILIDVRTNAISRKAGFSKSDLDSLMRRNGILYRHMPGLGATREDRDELEASGDYGKFFKSYKAHMITNKTASMSLFQTILDGIDDLKVAVMCYEADPTKCHRSALAEVMQGADPGLEVIHLPVQQEEESKVAE